MNYKQISKKYLVAFAALAIIFPSVCSAITPEELQAQREEKRAQREEQRAENKARREEQRAEKTCTQLSNQADQIIARLTEKLSNLEQKRTEVENNVQQRINERIANRTAKRAEWDATKAANWEKLRANAKTDEQKTAVEKFITAIQSAVKIKRDAIDKVISDFRAGIKAERAERKNQTDTALATYKDAITSIASQVKADCAAGKDAKTIRENLRTEMKKARDAFQANRKPAEKFRADITPLKEAKKAELKKIIDTFQASIEAAKTELRAAFPKTEEATETATE